MVKVKVTYLHYNPFQYPREKVECRIFKGNDIKKARKKVCYIRKRKGINPYRLTIKEVKSVIL